MRFKMMFIVSFALVSVLLIVRYTYAGEIEYPFGLARQMSVDEAKKILTKNKFQLKSDDDSIFIKNLKIEGMLDFYNVAIRFGTNGLNKVSIYSVRPDGRDTIESLSRITCLPLYEKLLELAVLKYGPPLLTYENNMTNYRPSYLWGNGNTLVKLKYGCLLPYEMRTRSTLSVSERDTKIFPNK